ncbi:glycosyltransferase family 2 protein [Algoriphagus sp. D3-2-R+10]|uniref:glycosyltransferase family A protein n=1 Tax=Algoriphagus aurantiacus TaxID=3103948 RepID=UPI002B3A7507|nr:glycosyltransferase family 2 protein [Algoriphagus sp. D3-2-R+10]MEB2776041.1 glycosyltransferase family 2 protein [Algoriphagus sp. D3-2-R+10]
MEKEDRVTVICIAFNHEKWIEKALDSVLSQSYESVELIIADNGSSDQTAGIIRDWVKKHSFNFSISVTYKSESIPYCKLFNELLNLSNGEFVVDLSGDDFLYPQHLSFSVDRLKQVPNAAFVFSDAFISEENGARNNYYQRIDINNLRGKILEREFYQLLISKSFISSPTVVFRTQILRQEEGYDALLTYEDFDIQLRLTNKYPVVFSDHVGVYKRKHPASFSANQYKSYHSDMLPSTLRVCEKIRAMNRASSEDSALKARVLFELKHALWSANFDPAKGFVILAKQLEVKSLEFSLYRLWLRIRLDISWLYVTLT